METWVHLSNTTTLKMLYYESQKKNLTSFHYFSWLFKVVIDGPVTRGPYQGMHKFTLPGEEILCHLPETNKAIGLSGDRNGM